MSLRNSTISVILGTGGVGNASDPQTRYTNPADTRKYLEAFRSRGYNALDTAQLYPLGAPTSCESLLGNATVSDTFSIGTKVISASEGDHSKENIAKNIDESLRRLKTNKVDILYLHFPRRETPFEETCEAINAAYKARKFEKFGLSGFSAAEVEKIFQIADKNSWIKPSVYQVQYNIVQRQCETELFKVLRKYNIACYAFSPAAGGFFANTSGYGSKGTRFDSNTPMGAIFHSIYGKDQLLAAAKLVENAAVLVNISAHAAALRWTAHHSKLSSKHGDGIIIAASTIQQLIDNLDAIEAGPLPNELVAALEDVWKKVEPFSFPYYV